MRLQCEKEKENLNHDSFTAKFIIKHLSLVLYPSLSLSLPLYFSLFMAEMIRYIVSRINPDKYTTYCFQQYFDDESTLCDRCKKPEFADVRYESLFRHFCFDFMLCCVRYLRHRCSAIVQNEMHFWTATATNPIHRPFRDAITPISMQQIHAADRIHTVKWINSSTHTHNFKSVSRIHRFTE